MFIISLCTRSLVDGVKQIQLELGGKDPAYVRKDVPNVAAAALSIADGAFYNCGQVGDPLEPETYIGPVARRAHLSFLASQVKDAMDKGAHAILHTGLGSSAFADGFYFPPTVLTDVNHTMQVMRDESFGPLIGIQAVDRDEEALTLMKDTPYGLTASVFCKHSIDAEEILRELDVGTGYWNCCDRVSPRLPW